MLARAAAVQKCQIYDSFAAAGREVGKPVVASEWASRVLISDGSSFLFLRPAEEEAL